MKKLFSVLFLSFLFSNISAQSINIVKGGGGSSAPEEKTVLDKINYRITYQLTFQPSVDTVELKQEKMMLLVGDSTSLFFSKNAFVRDSIMASFKGDNPDISRMMAAIQSAPKSVFSYEVIKRNNSQQIVFQEKVFMDKLAYTEPLPAVTWNITNETATKVGYPCQKATTTYGGRDYEAWFTFQIPIQDGPYKFSGLPGLIVEMYDTENHYHFTLAGLEKATSGEIAVSENKLINVSKEKFTDMKADFSENPFKMINASGGSITMKSKDGRDMSQKEMNNLVKKGNSKRNNPIELE
ncbi:MAG: GLPGLI family protein [Spirosomaceae bacterium]|nr:GLPGLI family protein [Spirosomataceae bacterium]